jgi:acyl-CoA thioester hydrolase
VRISASQNQYRSTSQPACGAPPYKPTGSKVSNQEKSFNLIDPQTYRHWNTVTIRYADEDRMGHVNNAAYGVWIEVARVALAAPYLAVGSDWLDTVLASATINYLKETRFPGDVRVGARLLHIGNKSFRSGYGVFRDEACLATAECTNVYFDARSRTSTVPTEAVRKVMNADLVSD